MIELRPYQADLIARTRAAMRSHRRVLVQAPTGAGKTAIAAFMVHGAGERNLRTLFLVHRRELVTQTARAYSRQGASYSLVQAGHGINPYAPHFIGSVQSLASRAARLPPIDLLIIDEAHHAVSSSWAAAVAAIAPRFIVGFSATPCRLDGRGLDQQFDVLVTGPSVTELMDGGFLSKYRAFQPSVIDPLGVRSTANDYNRGDLAAVMDKPAIYGDAVASWRKHASGKRAVVFCPTIGHAEKTRDAFRAAGISAESIDGSLDVRERAARLARFEAGATLILTSCDLVSEGFDLPAIEACIALRHTQSAALWIQQVGRVLRPAPGKTHAIILDHVGNIARHGLPDQPREWTLAGRKTKAQAGVAPVRICPSCYAASHPARRECPECGHTFAVAAREIEQRSGDLVELTPETLALIKAQKRAEVGKARTRDELERIARERGYKPGWVTQMMRLRGAA